MASSVSKTNLMNCKIDTLEAIFVSAAKFPSRRPYGSVEEMNEALVENWNRVVPKNGIVHISWVAQVLHGKCEIISQMVHDLALFG